MFPSRVPQKPAGVSAVRAFASGGHRGPRDCLPWNLAGPSAPTEALRGAAPASPPTLPPLSAPTGFGRRWRLHSKQIGPGADAVFAAGRSGPGSLAESPAESDSGRRPRPTGAGALVWFLTSHPLHVHEVNDQTRGVVGFGVGRSGEAGLTR
jgi:hypothetical protein